jgi:hypothetical protein
MKYIIPLLLSYSLVSITLLGQSSSPTSLYIKVDQFGYLPNSLKVAVISNPQLGSNSTLSFAPGSTLQVRNWFTDAIVYSSTPTIWNNGAVHDQSGDAGWWFDFSTITTEGDYYIYDSVNDVRSHRFKIDDDIYNQVLKSSVLMFYRNRIGNSKPASFNGSKWEDNTVNFTQDQQTRDLWDRDNAAAFKDLSGGWADAGDYNKYVSYTNTVIHDLLWAYQENPDVFGDNWNIPESNNNLPDILDEIKWELDWLMKMNNSDGSTHIKMGSLNYGDNSNSIPSQNNDPRYYGPTCSSAEIFVAGIFAHAAKVLSQFPSQSAYVNQLTSRAEQTWSHVLPQINDPSTLDLDCDLSDPANRIVSGDADVSLQEQIDMALKGAIHLWDLTGKNAYKNYIDANLYSAEPLSGNFYWNMYKRPLNDALLHYSTLSGVNTADRNAIRNSFQSELGEHLYFGMTNEDLYRSYMPNSQYHWGSNQIKAVIGVMNLMANNHNIDPANAADYRNKAEEHVHYFHGLNAIGITYLTNMYALGAEMPANEMYHQWFGDNAQYDNAISSPSGPAPGYVTGGPNAYTSVALGPPACQPQHKSYLDYNTVQNASWEITEPAIYYQSAYVRLIAAFSNAPAPCPSENTTCDDGNPKTTNDKADGFCGCYGDCPPVGTPCNDNDPLTINDRENGACLCIGDAPIEPQDCNEQVDNGDFSLGTNGWSNWGCDMNVVNGQLQLTNIDTSQVVYDSGLITFDIKLVQGRDYMLKFTAAASANRAVFAHVGGCNGTAYADQNFNLTTTMTEYTIVFNNGLPTTTEGTLDLFIANDTPDIFFDDFSIIELDCIECVGGNQELMSNGNFNNGTDPFFNWGSTVSVVNGQAIITDIIGSNPWDAALAQSDLNLETAKSYTISFDAKANSNRIMFLKLGLYDGNFTTFLYEQIALTPTMQSFSYNYTMTATTTNLGALEFFVGNDSPDVTIDNVSLVGECPDNVDVCEYDVLVTNPITKNLYQAENSVSSGATLTQSSPVEFGANNFIILENGFTVSTGVVFSATLNGCTQ